MTAVIMVFHAILCILLMAVILMQSGRGGGLTEAFSSAESVFGAKTSSFMVKATTIISILFIVTALSLAVLSSKKDRSLMESRARQPLPQDIQLKLDQAQAEAQKTGAEVEKTQAQAVQKVEPVKAEAPTAPEVQPAEAK